MKTTLGIALGLVVGLASSSFADEPYHPADDFGYSYPHYDPYHWHATTAVESYYRGAADYVRARGEFNRNTSEALINVEEARKRFLENKKLSTQTYFEMKRINQQYRDEVRKPAPTPEQIRRMAKAGVPDRADGSELNAATGKIHWPALLQTKPFDDYRAALDELFAARTVENSGVGSAHYHQVKRVTGAMKDELKRYLHDLDPSEYLDARKFIDKLAHEARFAPAGADVAAR